MKFLLFLAVLGGVAYFLMTRAQKNAVVQQVQQAPVQYTKALQNDAERATAVAAAAAKDIQKTGADMEKAAEGK
jgi:hypothetical protein